MARSIMYIVLGLWATTIEVTYLASPSAPRYTNSWAVEVRGGARAADQLARKHGFVNVGQVGNLKDFYHFTLEEGCDVHLLHKTEALHLEESVGYVQQQLLKRMAHKDYTVPRDPEWKNQWALKNTAGANGSMGLDLNVERAWLQGLTGKGVVVAVVDSGLEVSHPDLRQNYDARGSYDFADNDTNPSPDYSTNEPVGHGTSCAGEVAMVKNSNCGIGVAYESSIAGLRFNVALSSDLQEACALGYESDYIDVYSNSWGPADSGFLVQGPGKLVEKALETGAKKGRNGKGSIYVWAAGNGGAVYDSCVADGYASSIYTIAVGSADQNGEQANFDESCASKMAVTYSFNSQPWTSAPPVQISTTTVNGGCTSDFAGTSASTPLVAGVIALALQANPKLTWRDVQYLLVYTSNPDHLVPSSEWATNAAGLKFSHRFGFGAVDAEAVVTRARRWITVPEQQLRRFNLSSSSWTVPPNTSHKITFDVGDDSLQFVEHVVVRLSLKVKGYSMDQEYDYDLALLELCFIDPDNRLCDREIDYDTSFKGKHPQRGDVKLDLLSPQGTTSTLLPFRKYDFVNAFGYTDWPFMSVHFWGENPVGMWDLLVTYQASEGYVFVSQASIELYGTSDRPDSVAHIPDDCDQECSHYCSGEGADFCDGCKHLRNATNLECITSCSPNTTEYNGYCVVGSVEYPPSPPSSPSSNSLVIILGSTVSAGVMVCIVAIVLVICVGYRCNRVKRRQSRARRIQSLMFSDEDGSEVHNIA